MVPFPENDTPLYLSDRAALLELTSVFFRRNYPFVSQADTLVYDFLPVELL